MDWRLFFIYTAVMKQNQKGFIHHLGLIVLLLIVIAAIGFTGWRVVSHKKRDGGTASPNSSGRVIWDTDQKGNWTPSSTPPDCPAQPMLSVPVEPRLITSVLYPGQYRGDPSDINNYKSHGGFRFDNLKNNDVQIRMPISGYVTETARYTVQGQTQATFNVQNPCGVMVKFGHLLKLSSQFQAIADKATVNPRADSHTTAVNPPVYVKKGDLVATRTGIPGNTFLDFGVYDLRTTNASGKDMQYVDTHGGPIYMSLSAHAVCWLHNWLPSSDEQVLNSLPAGDSNSGKTSDYCK
jgi:hypothetical protein